MAAQTTRAEADAFGRLANAAMIAKAQRIVAQALKLKTTADVTTVDGGNIAPAMR